MRALRLRDRAAQERHGVTAAQMLVLHALAGDGEGSSLNDLAKRIATDQSSASVVVQRLVEGGLVTRTPRRDDRRHVELRLTSKGRGLMREAPPPAQETIAKVIASMSVVDRKRFAKLLETFVDELSHDE